VRTWSAYADHANLPTCASGIASDAPALFTDRSCDGGIHTSTKVYRPSDTTLQALISGAGSPWCWKGKAGYGGGVRMPLTASQQNGIANFHPGVASHALSGGIATGC
jgi:hypothetical protein